MSKHIDPRTNGYRTTDHSKEIDSMRDLSRSLRLTGSETARINAVILSTSADLLEAHDNTGISLDNWWTSDSHEGPRELVELGLELAGLGQKGTFLVNGI